MAIKPSSQATGRATKALKEQKLVRQKLVGKAKQKADQLMLSHNATERYKDSDGKTYQKESSPGTGYTAGRPGDNQRATDKYVSTKRRTTSKMKKKA